ncbi:sodium/calcium exchanger 1-like isoform X1 [Clavelina lepadiformis]|uniref:sodium/calcium exchanger 1-like isoform X1 n=1 Tax=Clavelina lepadiformis TaxID=159417 RepID=UPI0040438A48
MSTVEVITYFSNGYVVEYAPVDETGNFTEKYCQSWILLPAENLWPDVVRIILYILAIIYIFIGVAIGSDVFMTSIEVITSKKRTIVDWDEEKHENVKKQVLVWNETVANLTLLALGSSAPEILLATVEAINDLASGVSNSDGGLGFYTIVGSAAFNLLVITAVCIVSVSSPGFKTIRDLGVFALTSIWSLLAYVWLLAVLLWISPGIVEPWEAWITLLFFPILVLSAYAQDNSWWVHRWRQRKVQHRQEQAEVQTIANGITSRRCSVGLRSTPHRSPEKHRKTWSNGDGVCSISNGQVNDVLDGGSHLHKHRQRKNVSIVTPDPTAIELAVRQTDSHHAAAQTLSTTDDQERKYRPFARARFRHAAIRAMAGSRRIPANYTNVEDSPKPSTPKTEPRLLSVVSKIAAMRRLYASNNAIHAFPLSLKVLDESSGNIAFASSTYAVLESAGSLSVSVLFHRRKRPRGQIVIPTTNAEGKFDTQLVTGVVSVDYETREGTAKINKDFKYTSGTLIFTEEDFVQTINIPIINDDQYFPDTDFYIILKNPSNDASLGDPSVARVTIIDDDKPGDFILEMTQLYADMDAGEVQATVLRQNGCDGKVKIHYATVDGTAVGGVDTAPGVDYIQANGVLEFEHHETSKIITVQINKDVKETKNFVIVLRNPSQGSHLGEHSAAVANLNLQPGGINSIVIMKENGASWVGQIKSAMIVGGEVDEYGNEIPPSGTDFFLHAISMPWKIFFALAPTRNAFGGYPAFLVSMFMIGGLTAVIEQLGHLLGCVTGLKTQVTGITIIALGTSLPDTLASRAAALQDDYADASIGNITGSNSVNVFLGLGLPWVIRTMALLAGGKQYRVDVTSIEFSVMIFDSFGAVCVTFLFFRRFYFGGELGGPMRSKLLSAGFLILLWFIFIIVSSLKAYNYF